MIYADSTFFVALKSRRDIFHLHAGHFYERRQEERWLWSPWHRVEVFNTLRQLVRHPDRRYRLRPAETRMAIHLLENDVRAGYFNHIEADWRDVLRTANEISLAHGTELPCRSADLLHVAYAKQLAADLFVGFDQDQIGLADAAGLATVDLTTIRAD
jgi:predicted nucleic acid-binding protein